MTEERWADQDTARSKNIIVFNCVICVVALMQQELAQSFPVSMVSRQEVIPNLSVNPLTANHQHHTKSSSQIFTCLGIGPRMAAVEGARCHPCLGYTQYSSFSSIHLDYHTRNSFQHSFRHWARLSWLKYQYSWDMHCLSHISQKKSPLSQAALQVK